MKLTAISLLLLFTGLLTGWGDEGSSRQKAEVELKALGEQLKELRERAKDTPEAQAAEEAAREAYRAYAVKLREIMIALDPKQKKLVEREAHLRKFLKYPKDTPDPYAEATKEEPSSPPKKK